MEHHITTTISSEDTIVWVVTRGQRVHRDRLIFPTSNRKRPTCPPTRATYLVLVVKSALVALLLLLPLPDLLALQLNIRQQTLPVRLRPRGPPDCPAHFAAGCR